MNGEYSVTTDGLVAPQNGIIKLDNTASSYGTVSIDEWIGGAYVVNADLTFTAEAHKVITLTPGRLHRITITGGTSPVVAVANLAHHTA